MALTPQQIQAMKRLGVQSSEEATQRQIKMMFWGATGTWKTETVLRHLPNVFLIDAEGNSDQCVKNPEIPVFQRIKTADPRKALEAIDMIAEGLICMPDGQPIQTISIDSTSVQWSVQQDAAASMAEQRAARKNYTDFTVTPADWGKVKRPMKTILNHLIKTPVLYVVLIAREKDLTENLPNGESKKVGVIPNIVKDTDYDMNLILHFLMTGGRWGYEVNKSQGLLKTIFPLGAKGTEFPKERLLEYARRLNPAAPEPSDDTDDLPEQIASGLIPDTTHTQAALISYAGERGMSAQELGAMLKKSGFNGFDPGRWGEMIAIIDREAKPVAE